LLTNGGQMRDYWGVGGKASRPLLPLIAVPTTAGTGSECQSFTLITDEETHQKMACGDPKAAPRVAILDPTLTVSQPRRVTACTGLDAIAHAVETAVTKRRNPVSWLYAREAFPADHDELRAGVGHADDLEARGAMLLGAAYAGIAIENSMLGAAHSLANPLTAHFRHRSRARRRHDAAARRALQRRMPEARQGITSWPLPSAWPELSTPPENGGGRRWPTT
jgi:alcohol dehydrogenase